MGFDRSRLIAILIPTAGFIAATWMLAWPNHREASRLLAEAALLEKRIRAFSGQAEALKQLAARVDEAHKREALQTRIIPDAADLFEVMGSLSLEVDGETVADQTSTAGKSSPAVIGEAVPLEAMPLTIDMTARFDAVFDTIQAAENMQRLVRIASLRLSRIVPEKETDGMDPFDSTMINATIGLEAIYEVELPPEPTPPAGKGSTKEKAKS